MYMWNPCKEPVCISTRFRTNVEHEAVTKPTVKIRTRVNGHVVVQLNILLYFWIKEHMLPSEHSASIHSTEIDNVNTWLFLFWTYSCSNEVLLAIATMVKYSVVFILFVERFFHGPADSRPCRRFHAGTFPKSNPQNVPLCTFLSPVLPSRWVLNCCHGSKMTPPPCMWCHLFVNSSSAAFVEPKQVCRLRTGSFVVEKRKTF